MIIANRTAVGEFNDMLRDVFRDKSFSGSLWMLGTQQPLKDDERSMKKANKKCITYFFQSMFGKKEFT